MKKPVKDTKSLFPLWRKRPVIDFTKLKNLGLKSNDAEFVMSSLTEYLGGPEVVIPMVEEILSKTFIGKDGGYDFKFKIVEYNLSTIKSKGFPILYLSDIYAEVDRKGKVTIHAFEGPPTVSFDYLYNEMDVEEDFIWDVGHEITNIITDTLVKQIATKTGTLISDLNTEFTFANPSEFSAPIQENIQKIKRLL
jgi:hypothetical protein